MHNFESPDSAALRELCRSADFRHVLHPYEYIQGLLFAVCAAPEIPMPETWLPWVIKTPHQLNSAEQTQSLSDLLMKLLQQQLKNMSEERISLPTGVHFHLTDEAKNTAAVWCQGMLFGHQQLEPVWQKAWDKMQSIEPANMQKLHKDLRHCLYMFTTFADIPLAIKQAEERGNHQLGDALPTIFLSFPQTLKTYVGLSGRLVDYLPHQFETFMQRSP
ncbi:MAG: YecA family protein [Paraglaciecola sp.]|nr:YecA family protein [Paraglaciecola sp.]NCT48854.1 YecA family protein [Paraglaciecola sp.]